MHLPLLQDMLLLLGSSLLVVFVLQRLKLPSILGFLLTGVLIGPSVLGLIHVAHEVEMIAEIGVILLLFVIGMELSLKQLAAIRRTVFFGGLIQVGLTTLLVTFIAKGLSFAWNEAVFIGFLFSLSSTAVVLKILQDRQEITQSFGRNALGILIFQDIIVVPMMLVTPILAGNSDDIAWAVGSLLLKSAMVVGVTLVGARYLISPFFYQIAKTRNKELFLLATMTVCFAITFLTSEAGLSLALGAFLAGLIISESEYSHQATSTILPFRELFTSFFFISVGMLLDLSFFFENASSVLLLLLAVFVLKSLIAGLAAAALRYPPHTVIRTGLSLFQVGEFAFVLSKVGLQNDLLQTEVNQYFLSVSILSMLLTPFIFLYADRISGFLVGKIKKSRQERPRVEQAELEQHLIIVGYGINGRNVSRAAEYAHIPYCILELNPETVQAEKAKGKPIHFGDAASTHLLEAVHLRDAAIVVIAIADLEKTKEIIRSVREICKSVQLLVRTRFVREIPNLLKLGADEVIPEEFETSVEIFARVLRRFFVPVNEMKLLVAAVRQDNYHILQSQQLRTAKPIPLPDFKITALQITCESSVLLGPSIRELDLQAKFEVFILAIVREEAFLHPISPDDRLYPNDLLYLSGSEAGIEELYQALSYAQL